MFCSQLKQGGKGSKTKLRNCQTITVRQKGKSWALLSTCALHQSICSSISECLQRKYVFICIKQITYKRVYNLVNYYFTRISIVLSINSASWFNLPLKKSRENGITTLILTCAYVIHYIPTIRCLNNTVNKHHQEGSNNYKLMNRK